MSRSASTLRRIAVAFLVVSVQGLEAQEPPEAAYYIYVASESQDEVSLVRFGPGGAGLSCASC